MTKQKYEMQIASFSLRDWFAGQALSGLIARDVAMNLAIRTAYQIADAMMLARDK